MVWTVQQAIERAAIRGSLNDASLIPSAALVSYVSNLQRRIYLHAARVNPEYFGKSGTTLARANFSDSWDLTSSPGDIAAVSGVFVAAIVGTPGPIVGDRINLVTSRFPDLGVTPRAFIRSQKLYGHTSVAMGPELGASNSHMVTQCRIEYSELPPVVTQTATAMRLPEEWEGLVTLPLARMMALRDKREEEIQFLDQEYVSLVQTFDEALLIYDHGASRPLQSVPALPLTQGSTSA